MISDFFQSFHAPTAFMESAKTHAKPTISLLPLVFAIPVVREIQNAAELNGVLDSTANWMKRKWTKNCASRSAISWIENVT